MPQVDYGPFQVGTLCLCVHAPNAPQCVGRECEIVEVGRISCGRPRCGTGSCEYRAIFQDGIVACGEWSGKHVMKLSEPPLRVLIQTEDKELVCIPR